MKTTTPLALASLLALAGPVAGGQPPFRVDDFEDLDVEAAPGLSWFALGDWLGGGPSDGKITPLKLRPGEGSRGALRIEGHLRPGGKTMYAGAWTALRSDGGFRDLTGYHGLRFRVRGTPGRYSAGVRRADGGKQANFMAPFAVTATWTQVDIAFGDLAVQAPSQMAFAPTGVGWLGFVARDDSPHDFTIDVDDVEIVPENPDPPVVHKLVLTDPHTLDRLSFVTVGRDGRGDGVYPRLPDARELQVAADPAEDRVWFRFVLQDAPPADFFGMNVALDVDGDPANGGAWWGQNKGFHYDRLLTAYLNRGAGYWQGYLGVTDSASVAAGQMGAISADVHVAVDRARKTLAIGVPRAALGLPPGGKVRLIGTVGSNMVYNDDVPEEGALDVTLK
jgi:hypothetical protein